MIERRSEIQQDHRPAKHADADNEMRAANPDRRQYEYRHCHNREQQSEAMTDAVGDLFTERTIHRTALYTDFSRKDAKIRSKAQSGSLRLGVFLCVFA